MLIDNYGKWKYCQSKNQSDHLQASIYSNEAEYIHSRSRSMPEDVYLRQQGFIDTKETTKPREVNAFTVADRNGFKMEFEPSLAQPSKVLHKNYLRRSRTTNVADLTHRYQDHCRFMLGSGVTSMMALEDGTDNIRTKARSRSNIAAMGILQSNHNVNTKSDFDYVPSNTMGNNRMINIRSRRSSRLRNISQPLYIDCSVEYDLGEQLKIPKNSSPLLIIHPSCSNQKRYHPYDDTSDNSSKITDENTFSIGFGGDFLSTPTQQIPYNDVGIMSKSEPSKALLKQKQIVRHSSFLVPTSTQLYNSANHHHHYDMLNNETFFGKNYTSTNTRNRISQVSDYSWMNMKSLCSETACSLYGSRTRMTNHISVPDIPLIKQQRCASRARINLCPKLEAIRTFSSSDSGTSGVGHGTGSFTPFSDTGSVALAGTLCDSGLGSPYSLHEDTEGGGPLSASTPNSQYISAATKIKNNISDLVAGFLCCSGSKYLNRMSPSPLATSSSYPEVIELSASPLNYKELIGDDKISDLRVSQGTHTPKYTTVSCSPPYAVHQPYLMSAIPNQAPAMFRQNQEPKDEQRSFGTYSINSSSSPPLTASWSSSLHVPQSATKGSSFSTFQMVNGGVNRPIRKTIPHLCYLCGSSTKCQHNLYRNIWNKENLTYSRSIHI